jgi:hypothetical protein
MSTLIRNVFNRGRYNNYLIGGNVCNAFAIGELGSTEDFFLVGAEPEPDCNYPLLTGNILDSEGNVLFRLVKNMLVINPGHCSKILGDLIGYEIHDGNGHHILKVETKFETLPGEGEGMFVTKIAANFFNRQHELVFEVHSGGENERIESRVKSAFGFSGGFGLVQGMNDDEMSVARLMLTSRGSIHRVLTGPISGQTLSLDGAAVFNAQVTNCEVHITTGDFAYYGKNVFRECNFVLKGAAQNIRQLVLSLPASNAGES